MLSGGGTVSKNMAFVVDLDSSSEIKTPKSDPNIPSDKLSNFLPGNLRKSIHQRKERLLQLTEKNQTEVRIQSDWRGSLNSQFSYQQLLIGSAYTCIHHRYTSAYC